MTKSANKSKQFLKNVHFLDEEFTIQKGNIEIENGLFTKITKTSLDNQTVQDNKIDSLYIPGFYNLHAHSPMTLMRGFGDGLPLQKWLEDVIFPYEETLDEEKVYQGTLLALRESLASGIVSTSDMYFFTDAMCQAYQEVGAKGNISRSLVCFDDDYKLHDDKRFLEAQKTYQRFHQGENGKLKIDMSLHAIYTTKATQIKQLASYAKEIEAIVHVHLSETQKEQTDAYNLYKMTPTQFFLENELLENQVLFAHGVYLNEEDCHILSDHNASVSLCPTSNLKLKSGVANMQLLLKNSVNTGIGTDSVASNNSLNFPNELKMTALLMNHFNSAEFHLSPKDILYAATRAGALAQGRQKSGLIKEGFSADYLEIDFREEFSPNLNPQNDVLASLVYSFSNSNILKTVVDGNVLYSRDI